MGRIPEFTAFLALTLGWTLFWGRINRSGHSSWATWCVRRALKHSRISAEAIRSYLIWGTYMVAGIAGAAVLSVVYGVNLVGILPLRVGYLPLVALAFVAQNAVTGLLMQLWLVARPRSNVFADLTNVLWVRYTLRMPGVTRVLAPLCAAVSEEVFFRGAVFLILTRRFAYLGSLSAVALCTAMFVLHQILQTDTLGQAVIFGIGSTSISVIGCLAMLYTGSFLPTLICHAGYSVVYFRLGTVTPWRGPSAVTRRSSTARALVDRSF